MLPRQLVGGAVAVQDTWLARTLLKSTNMHMEGLVSEVKAAVPKAKRSPHAERLAYLPRLSRLMKQHLARGRLDYRGDERRETLLSRGAPLEGSGKRSRRADTQWRSRNMDQ